MNILVTGSEGFIGKNLRHWLMQMHPNDAVYNYDIDTPGELELLCQQADFVFHLAGVNRPENPEEFKSGNAELTDSLLKMLEKEDRRIPLVLSSSTGAELDTPYGRSKKQAEEIVFKYAKKTGAAVYVYRLPNVFGKWCRPNYNSVVATFCHNAASGIPLRVDDPYKQLTLLYIDDIINEFGKIAHTVTAEKASSGGGSFRAIPDGYPKPSEKLLEIEPVYKITLLELADAITSFAESRRLFTIG